MKRVDAERAAHIARDRQNRASATEAPGASRASSEAPAPAVPPRVAIENISPQVDGGRFPAKRTVGEQVAVEADIHAEGNDVLAAAVRYRAPGAEWNEAAMEPQGNDRWRATFTVTSLGLWEFEVLAWVDAFATWRRDLRLRVESGQDVAGELPEGALLVDEAVAQAPRAAEEERASLAAWAAALRDPGLPVEERVASALDAARAPSLAALAARSGEATGGPPLRISVDRERARYSAWYEMFPRSTSGEAGRHGTFRDAEARLPYVAEMGFDILYLPPIHPIGRTHRKGKNGALAAGPGDPGSPWAIGAGEGGHTSVHPELGTLEDFRRFRSRAAEHGLEVALDLAFQCSPDHPWVREHPEWFRHRTDGSIRFAENPPKRYEDIYPFEFECADWRALWEALRDVVRFWIDEGVRIFRVDNPHTKPYAFWEWLIATVRADHPETIFLAEAFTRPRVMQRLAKLGFQQSYTYFAWRNTSRELRDYFTELTQGEMREYLRPNLWPNTPDILTEYLQTGGRPAFVVRLVLAATLGASYGIYGPAFELCENAPLEPGREDYLNAEKYEIRVWDLDRPGSLRHLAARLNRVRRENPALQNDRGLMFLETTNDALLAFVKTAPPAPAGARPAMAEAAGPANAAGAGEEAGAVLVVVNLDPHHAHGGWIDVPLERLGLDVSRAFQVHDLLSNGRFLWSGARNYVHLDPSGVPAHVFRVRRRLRTERDFDYYL